MPSRNKAEPQGIADQTLVLDNGAYTIKAGFASEAPQLEDCKVIPNCIARSFRDKRFYIGSQLDHECKDYGELQIRRPVEKGYVVNWESEKCIWDYTFFNNDAELKVCIESFSPASMLTF